MKLKFIKNLGRGFIISILTLSSLSVTLYHDDAFAGGNGGSSAGDSQGNQGSSANNAKAGNASNIVNGRTATNSVSVQTEVTQVQDKFTRQTYKAWLEGLLDE
jgi:hypothetical protein